MMQGKIVNHVFSSAKEALFFKLLGAETAGLHNRYS